MVKIDTEKFVEQIDDNIEQALFIEGKDLQEGLMDIIFLLDIIHVISHRKHLSKREVDIFRKWKHYLMSQADYVYIKDIVSSADRKNLSEKIYAQYAGEVAKQKALSKVR